MIQQRLGETDSEYEKRKKRVAATYRTLGFGLAHGGGTIVLAAIIYDGTLLNIAAERFLKDVGSSPLENAKLYSGRAKQFATDMSMPITVEAEWYLYKFDHDTDTFVEQEIVAPMTTYELGKVDGSGAYEAKTYGLVFVFTSQLSTADFNLMTEEPEALANMIVNNVADTRFTVTKSDCKGCFTLTENGKYCRNYAEDLGSELSQGISTAFAGSDATITTVDDILKIEFTSDSGYGYSRLSTTTPSFLSALPDSGDIIKFTMKVRFSSLIPFIELRNWSDVGKIRPLNVDTWETVAFISVANGGATDWIQATGAIGAIGHTVEIDLTTITTKKVTASEILNYATLPAPDIRALNTGLQTTPLKLDSLGMVDGVSDGMEWHSEENAVTPTRTKTADITIEITPNIVESILLVDTTIGDITMNANGTVTTSSGNVDIDTTTLQADVKSIVTITGISISGVSTLFSDLDGTIHNYNEETV